ncbi:late competence development ComFB family protein [Fusibacter ferrireducens]|uniref:Late competence development ComFB family protein n=1 Tax=Fusibacter ferrireducens TaxID=2785058 RepID=A0ABR9ZMZ9_9FIRM|nr:late competence development ComFB family protein [Fusibacter ferrireducens]MBF4691811.1 late competence development ComFB family protein [Fusibacter ferrireducens]
MKNCMETIVLETFESVKLDYCGLCSCEKCKKDILAMCLNRLPPLYFTSEKGEIYTKLNEFKLQFRVNVIQTVTEAVEIVMTHPRHTP